MDGGGQATPGTPTDPGPGPPAVARHAERGICPGEPVKGALSTAQASEESLGGHPFEPLRCIAPTSTMAVFMFPLQPGICQHYHNPAS
jgi:hypothetical protein